MFLHKFNEGGVSVVDFQVVFFVKERHLFCFECFLCRKRSWKSSIHLVKSSFLWIVSRNQHLLRKRWINFSFERERERKNESSEEYLNKKMKWAGGRAVKAPVSGTGLFGGAGSIPVPLIHCLYFPCFTKDSRNFLVLQSWRLLSFCSVSLFSCYEIVVIWDLEDRAIIIFTGPQNVSNGCIKCRIMKVHPLTFFMIHFTQCVL